MTSNTMDIEIAKALSRLAIQEINNEVSQHLTQEDARAIIELLKELERKDANLAAVTAERDALRRLMPSWSGAPKQAMYLTMDENGRWGWHEVKPSPCSNMWSGATWLGDAHVGAWQTMVFERPTR